MRPRTIGKWAKDNFSLHTEITIVVIMLIHSLFRQYFKVLFRPIELHGEPFVLKTFTRLAA